MVQQSINYNKSIIHNAAIEPVQWLAPTSASEKKLAQQVLAFQTTRISPNVESQHHSKPYQTFNLGLHVGDCPQKVQNNRRQLQKLLPENAKIQWLEQVHSSDVIEVKQVSETALVADATVTQSKNTCLAIMTADCLPILLVSQSGNEIAAIHGGWRPLAANIIANTLAKMKTPNAEVYAWLGPCIAKNAFEVGAEVKFEFTQQGNEFNTAFTTKGKGKYLADLHQIARLQLENLGITHISALPECTFSNTQKYYSYRKNSVTGRMATLICIR
ncbi:purine nucleoside phosphorylase YfiH [Colwellia sp. KU-HH00111]|uniref:peptidoglycan editing factor PgeF n=1 Tax=Colwellia sp. KU-HH00111 TaxID=3127652 RepID=UPI0031051BA1